MTKWEKIEATPNDDRYFGYCTDMGEYLKIDGAMLPKCWGKERQIIRKEENKDNAEADV